VHTFAALSRPVLEFCNTNTLKEVLAYWC